MQTSELNTGYPGHIYNFDPATQRGEVQVAIESLFTGFAEAYSTKTKNRLLDVPIQFIQGGNWSLTHPVPDGTPCYIHFAQKGIEHWKQENKDAAGLVNGLPAPSFNRKFNINDCVAIVGTQPMQKVIKGFLANGCELRNADRSQRVTLEESGTITILTAGTHIVIQKDGDVTITSPTQATVKAPQITLDGATTVTKSLTVQGGMAISGSLPSGATSTIDGNFTMTGDITQTGTFTLGGVVVNGHTHKEQGDGNNVGPMK